MRQPPANRRWVGRATLLVIVAVLIVLGVRRWSTAEEVAEPAETNEQVIDQPEPPTPTMPASVASSTTAASRGGGGAGAVSGTSRAGSPAGLPVDQARRRKPVRVAPDSALRCSYGESPDMVVCECDGSSTAKSAWSCRPHKPAPVAECPPDMPVDQMSCSPATLTCFYGEGLQAPVCVCNGDPGNPRWTCMTYQQWMPLK